MSFQNQISANGFNPLHENVFVTDLDSGLHITKGGIITVDDDMQFQGIRPRWGRVWAVGPEVKDLVPGEWIYIEHARWTNAINIKLPSGTVKVWRVEYPKAVLLASKEDPRVELWNSNVVKIKR
jgi:hypothetical protein